MFTTASLPRRVIPLFILALSMFFAWTEQGFSHGMGWQSDDSFSVVVQFMYDDGEPMAYGSVKVFSPENDTVQYQGGRSDRNGYFAFCPDAPGKWTFIGDDGQGHVTEGAIDVTDADLTGGAGDGAAQRVVVQGGAQKPNAFQILLGLSILLNLALASMWYQAKKRTVAHAAKGA